MIVKLGIYFYNFLILVSSSMATIFRSTVLYQHKRLPARIMEVVTPHGKFETPTFMPVGTRAAINGIQQKDLQNTDTTIILGGNTYHMLNSPGMDAIRICGGMHEFMNWNGPMLTDSGGFQVFSISKKSPKKCRIDDTGARFQQNDGKIINLSPKTSILTQKIIGADIIMAFDECTTHSDNREESLRALNRTHRWLSESRETHEYQPFSEYGNHQAFFGIIQGGYFRDLREQSTQFILDMETDGIAIGGEVIGSDMNATEEIISWIMPQLPTNKVRYTMGVGLNPCDLIAVVKRGIDMFDCVAPTRNARHGALYHGHPKIKDDWVTFDTRNIAEGRLLIKKGEYARDERPILEDCSCTTCRNYSRSYLHYLFKSKQTMYNTLSGIHNIHVMQNVCRKMREIIKQNSY